GVDLGDRPRNLKIQNPRGILQPLRMLGAPEDGAAIGALALEHAARIMQPMGQHMDVGVAPRHQFAVVPDDAVDFVERNSHRLSPGLTLLSRLAPRAVALLVTPGSATSPTAGFRVGIVLRTCFCGMRKSSMFAEMPLDNR